MRKVRTETYEHAISALLSRRSELMTELAGIRERSAIITNDVEAMDRTLEQLGYESNDDVKLTPRIARIVLFYRGELRHFILDSLREHGPSTTRDLAIRLITLEGKDAIDRRMRSELGQRISKALRQMLPSKLVTRTRTKSMNEYLWRLPED